MNILVTAGATREYIDPTRFISNPSSGRMGIEVANVAKKRGHSVVLIIGHISVKVPKGIPFVRASSAVEMDREVKRYVLWADALVMIAGVSDWRCKKVSAKKIKKGTKKILNISFVRNPDVLANASKFAKKKKKNVFIAGFSVDTQSLVDNAKKKLKTKNIDLIVANRIDTALSGFGAKTSYATMIEKNGEVTKLSLMSKKQLAIRLMKRIEKN